MKVLKTWVILASCVAVLAACATPQAMPATPQVVEKVVTQVVEKQVVQTQVVQQTVEVISTQVVTPTPVPFEKRDQLVLVHSGNPGALADHPWTAMVEEYNRTHPDVYVELNLVSGDYWTLFGTWLAAGNLPDVMAGTAAGMMGYPATQLNLVDVRPLLDDETRKDLGTALDGVTLPDGRVMGFPLLRNWGDWVCVNNKDLQAAGVSWQDIYAKDGWTWQEWQTAASKMTTDANGKHPGDSGFDEKNVKTWAFGVWRDYTPAILFNMTLNAGVPDGNSAAIQPMWGNSLNWTGPKVLEALRWWQDWHTKYKIATPATLSIGSDAEVYNMIVRGELASTWDFPYWCRTAVRDYNQQIEEGNIAGNKVDTDLVILPVPHEPNSKGANLERSSVLSVFRQTPDKGEAHTQHALELAKWLMTTERQAAYANWANGIPARTSAQGMVAFLQKDENYQAHVKYALAHAAPTFPYGHPVSSKWQTEAMVPALEALAKGSTTPEQAMQQMTEAGDRMLADWVKTADADTVKQWSQPPSWWPGPNFPDWKIRLPHTK